MSLSAQEVEDFFKVIEEFTGTCQQGRYRKDLLFERLQNALRKKNKSWSEYKKQVYASEEDKKEFLSFVTIHTTSWFREKPHFEIFQKWVEKNYRNFSSEKKLTLWSSACSTGEEPYSFALFLEDFRCKHPTFDYQVFASDLDTFCVERAKRAIYSEDALETIPEHYRHYVFLGSGKTQGLLTLDPEIRKRCAFFSHSLLEGVPLPLRNKVDTIVCRNVLIYFDPDGCEKISKDFFHHLKQDGLLIFGHSEMVSLEKEKSCFLGNSVYQKATSTVVTLQKDENKKKKVLVVDDSKSLRLKLRRTLESSGFDVDEAVNPREATEKTKKNVYDVLTLDLNMESKNDGLLWLREARLQKLKTPIVILTEARQEDANFVLSALETGAQDFMMKSILSQSENDFCRVLFNLAESVEQRQTPNLKKDAKFLKEFSLFYPDAILVGASTGGIDAIHKLLASLTESHVQIPPVFVVQHIHSTFSQSFAKRLSNVSGLELVTPQSGDLIQNNKLYVALEDEHLGLKKKGNQFVVWTSKDAKISGHRPSVDFLFSSVANTDMKCFNILLTGMGKDGAQGMFELSKNGNHLNFAQDESSCVVYGMPRAAVESGAVHFSGNLKQIRSFLDQAISLQNKKTA